MFAAAHSGQLPSSTAKSTGARLQGFNMVSVWTQYLELYMDSMWIVHGSMWILCGFYMVSLQIQYKKKVYIHIYIQSSATRLVKGTEPRVAWQMHSPMTFGCPR